MQEAITATDRVVEDEKTCQSQGNQEYSLSTMRSMTYRREQRYRLLKGLIFVPSERDVRLKVGNSNHRGKTEGREA